VLRESSANMRESIYRRLLEIGVYLLARSEKITLDNILDIIKKQFFGVMLEKKVAEEYLQQLKEEGTVKAENGKYILEDGKKSQIESYSRNALTVLSSCETRFVENVKQKMGVDISKEDNEVLTDCFYKFVIDLISRYIVNTARLLVKGTLKRIPAPSGTILVDTSTRNITNKKLQRVVRATLAEWMQSPGDDFIQYLFYMRQNFLCIEVLNLDPQCRMLEREEFSKKRLFLDTNILLGLVLQSRYHEENTRLINNTRKLGCSVYVTKRTLDEFNMVLDKSKKSIKGIKATPYQLSKIGNVFIQTYGMALLSGRSLSPDKYMDQFSEAEKLIRGIGIQVFNEEHKDIKELPEYGELIKDVQSCFSKLRARAKTDDVAEHDAFHLLLVKTLREPETDSILGPNAWFLSSDLTLACSDKFIRKTFSFSQPTSAVMIADIWNEIISPFLIGIVTEKDLVAVLKSFISSEFTPISEGINAATLAKLEIDWTEYDWLEIEEIQDIIHQKFVLDYITRREELSRTGDAETIEQLRSEFNVAFSRLIGQISSRKIQHIQAVLEEQKKETNRLKVSVEDLEETKTELQESLTLEQRARVRKDTLTIRMRYISGIAGITSLIIGAILIALIKETASWQATGAYIALLILGAILLLMSIRPEQVSALLGFKQ